MAVSAFRKFANDLRVPDYQFGRREVKGALNLTFGTLQLITAVGMRVGCCGDRYRGQKSNRHFQIGWEALRVGARELFPSAFVALGLYLAYTARDFRTD